MTSISRNGSGGAFKGLAWLGGALATLAAIVVGAVLAVVFTATAVVIALMASALLALGSMAMRARRAVRRPADPEVIEARHMGGHSWVAYGWNDRP